MDHYWVGRATQYSRGVSSSAIGNDPPILRQREPRIMSEPIITTTYAVVDDLLLPSEFKLVHGLLKKAKLVRPAVEPHESVWSVGGVLPYALQSGHHPAPVERRDTRENAALRLFSDRLSARLPGFSSVVGEQGGDWRTYTLTLYAYPQGAELNWHRDEGRYTGAFTFYLHERWEAYWGGELLVEESGSPLGGGLFLPPTPNRLVLIKGGTPHKIAAVSSRAGDHLRIAITGFFFKSEQK